MDTKQQGPAISLPASIIIAGALIAVAVIWTNKPAPSQQENTPNEADQVAIAADPNQVAPIASVTDKDHILGNPNAPIKIVEYSDPSCPFCKMFNETMVGIMAEYGAGGKVAWIYRSFPIDKLHPKARKESEAFECAADLGGNKSFWDYQKLFYSRTPSVTFDNPEGFDAAKLPDLAAEIGLDKAAFTECLNSGRMKAKVDAQYNEGVKAGINLKGTPYSILIGPDGRNVPILGAQPASAVKQIIDVFLD